MSRLLRQLRDDIRGAAIIELALVAPVLAVMTIGIVDMSNAFSRKLALEQGAQRAIEKIMQTTGETSVEGTLKTEAVCQVNGMNADKTCKTAPITVANVAVTFRLECRSPSGGGLTVQSSTDATAFDALTCPSGDRESRYITVNVTDKYVPMFSFHFTSYSAADSGYNLSASAGMRVQ